MDYDYSVAREEAEQVLANPDKFMSAKSDKMNDILNYEIPYFRCSDDDIVKVYYFLQSLYMMYYTEVGKHNEKYPHT